MEPNKKDQLSPEEYRERQDTKSRRRQKKRLQRIALVSGMALAAVLLIVCISMIFKAVFGGIKQKPSSSASTPASSASIILPEPVVTIPRAADPSAWNLKIINAQEGNAVAPDFAPELTVFTTVGHWFDTRTVDQLKQMIADCNAVEGNSLQVQSAYRSFKNQSQNFNDYITQFRKSGMSVELAEAETLKIYERPGTSEHQTGLAIDFYTAVIPANQQSFAGTPEYVWLLANAKNYGFILRYPADKTEITGKGFEPWHFRFVGVQEAIDITDHSICLEEYVSVAPTTQPEIPAEDAFIGPPAP